jgi:hypothetical protein
LFDEETAVVIAVVQTSMPDTSYRVRVSLAAESLSSPSYKSISMLMCALKYFSELLILLIRHAAQCRVLHLVSGLAIFSTQGNRVKKSFRLGDGF